MTSRTLTLLVLLAACTTATPPPEPLAAQPSAVEPSAVQPSTPSAFDRAALEAKTIATVYCGKCHNRTSKDAVPGALAIFDLEEDPWYGRMSGAQLEKAIGRMESKGTSEERERFISFIHSAIERLKEADRCASRSSILTARSSRSTPAPSGCGAS